MGCACEPQNIKAKPAAAKAAAIAASTELVGKQTPSSYGQVTMSPQKNPSRVMRSLNAPPIPKATRPGSSSAVKRSPVKKPVVYIRPASNSSRSSKGSSNSRNSKNSKDSGKGKTKIKMLVPLRTVTEAMQESSVGGNSAVPPAITPVRGTSYNAQNSSTGGQDQKNKESFGFAADTIAVQLHQYNEDKSNLSARIEDNSGSPMQDDSIATLKAKQGDNKMTEPIGQLPPIKPSLGYVGFMTQNEDEASQVAGSTLDQMRQMSGYHNFRNPSSGLKVSESEETLQGTRRKGRGNVENCADDPDMNNIDFVNMELFPRLDVGQRQSPTRNCLIQEDSEDEMATVRGSQAACLEQDYVVTIDQSGEVFNSDNLSDTQEIIPELHIGLSQQNIVVEDF